MSPSDKPPLSVFREIKLLSTLTDAEIGRLITFGQMQKREAHSNIVIEGEFSWGLFLLLQGMVGIFKTNKLTGTAYDVGQLRDPGFFGELSLIDENPRAATVKALTDCQVFYISREAFYKFVGTAPDLKLRFYEACIRNLVSRLRELDDSYVVSQYQLWKVALRKDAA